MTIRAGQRAAPGSLTGQNWLSAQASPFGSTEFSSLLSTKLQELGDTGGQASSVMGLHYNNVALGYAHQYGLDVEAKGANAAVVTRSGEQGSAAEIRVPATAALLQKAWNIIVGPELTWSAVPSTTDFASEAKAVNARNALAYLWTHENAGAIARGSALDALFQAESLMHVPWDKSLGTVVSVDETDPDDPKVTRSGWMRFTPIPTWDVLRDRSARSFEQQGYTIIREWQNKFDRAAMCDTIEKAASCKCAASMTEIGQSWAPFAERYEGSGDLIPVYYLYAKPSPSVPAGRQTIFLEDGTILEDSALDEAYETQLPVLRMAAGEYRGTPWPYSKYFACMGAGQAADALLAGLLTNSTSIGAPVYSVEADNVDSGAALTTLGAGPQLVTRPVGSKMPDLLEQPGSLPDHFKLLGTLRNEVQQIIGLDNLTAGEDIGANLSGAAMVMMTSTSVQNNSQLQASWRDYVQAIGNVALKHIQFHMTETKRIALAGNARASLVTTTELSGDSVDGIERVTCSIGSAMTQTDAGKYEIATTALKEKWVQTPEQFQTVMDTGRLDALTQDLSSALLLIASENEALGKGEQVPVTPYDNHRLHIQLHQAVLASLTARRQMNVLRAVQQHLDEHVTALMSPSPMNQAIMNITGQPAMAPAQGAAAETPGAPFPEGAPEVPQGVPTPQAPKDPRTAEPAQPVAGVRPPGLTPERMPQAA